MRRSALREHLLASRIAGDVRTPRASNVRALRRLADGDEASWFGLEPGRSWTFEELLEVMVRRCGIDPDPTRLEGGDTISVDLCLDGLDAMRESIQRAARDRVAVFLASGHPAGVLAIHLRVAEHLRSAGCRVLTPGAGTEWTRGDQMRQLRYLGGVAVLSHRGELNHTHAAGPMQALLAQGLRPDLVLADHGWAGAAGQAGIETACFADCNDPALFVGADLGRVAVSVPLDDNVLPHLYDPLAGYLVSC